MYLKRGHPLLIPFNKVIRRMTEVGLISKWKKDFISKRKIIKEVSVLTAIDNCCEINGVNYHVKELTYGPHLS